MNAMKKIKRPLGIGCTLGLLVALLTAVTPLTTHASGSYVSPNALLKKKPGAEPAPTPTPEAKKKK
jgi:hypothetical protein